MQNYSACHLCCTPFVKGKRQVGVHQPGQSRSERVHQNGGPSTPERFKIIPRFETMDFEKDDFTSIFGSQTTSNLANSVTHNNSHVSFFLPVLKGKYTTSKTWTHDGAIRRLWDFTICSSPPKYRRLIYRNGPVTPRNTT